jgi:hypothetical protein
VCSAEKESDLSCLSGIALVLSPILRVVTRAPSPRAAKLPRRFNSAAFISALSGQFEDVGRQVTKAVTKRNGGRSTP